MSVGSVKHEKNAAAKGFGDGARSRGVVEPLLEASMGREHKRRQPWHLFLLVSLVKIPSAWQMASVLFTAPDKLPGSYWCKTGQLSTNDIPSDPCSICVFHDVIPTTTVTLSGKEDVAPNEYFEFPMNYQHTDDQDTVNEVHSRVYNTTNVGPTVPSNFSVIEETLYHEQFNISGDYYTTDDQSKQSTPSSSHSAFNITRKPKFELSASNLTVPCQEFQFAEGYYSIIDQWQLVCGQQILVPVSQSFYLLGVLCGGIIFKYLNQIWSPRIIIIGGMIAQIVAGVGVAFSPYFALHCALRCITAIACTQMFTAGYSICTGLMEGKAKTVAGCCYEHLWSVGVITLPCLATLFSDWRHLQLAISLPTTALLLCLRFIPESPEWKPRKRVRKKKQISLENGTARADKISKEMNVQIENSAEKIKASCQSLTKESPHKLKYIGLHGVWLFTVVTYYGGLLNAKNLGPELFLNTATAGAAEIAGVLIGLLILLRKSRVWLSLGAINISGGLFCLLSWTLPTDLEQWYPQLLLLGMLGRIAIATSLTILTLASASQFPPAIKLRGMFTCVTFARVFLLQAPFIGTLAMYGERVSLSVFGTFTLLAGLCALTQITPTQEGEGANTGQGKTSYELEAPAHYAKKASNEV